MSVSRPAQARFRAAIPIRPRFRPNFVIRSNRTFSDAKDDAKPSPEVKGPNMDQLPHVSEEAAATAKITGEKGPDLQQGTPIQEILQGDKSAQEHMPKVIKDEIKPSNPKGSRSFSTSARRPTETIPQPTTARQEPAVQETESLIPGIRIPTDHRLRQRYDPLVHQVTNLLMRDGKLGVAQRNMAEILNHLRTSPPPTPSPQRPLLPGSPPPSHLPLNPTLYMTVAIDSVAPLLRIRAERGAAGGGVALQIPIPLGQRQRRRQAVQWILDAASKRKNRGSGRGGFAQRVAEELIAVAEGRSGVWERRGVVHKLGVSARVNLNSKRR
ncbi:ribosomal protein S7 [Viridothelium virens]|uniref:Small ribosomal subunit protein uS7m n=1 Tax=Viridothelium virens TaxID=1048519 RepID=A0A6A6HMA5_VIRVR|nr:ribosomal protein S7 [Viridothelium virens]